MANDMSARPHEILNLKIKDIVFKITEEGTQFAEVLIAGGKTKPRTLPLIDSIPYLKDWILDHPTGTNPDSWLFVSLAYNTFGSKLTYDGLFGHYTYYYKIKGIITALTAIIPVIILIVQLILPKYSQNLIH
ncbi:MAG: hypothetical protein WA667_29985 [Candidatus Nitrosopolaris sp.]